jgi:hypothetical protein
VSRGHPFSAIPDTIRCLKQRAIAGRRLYEVTFESQQPSPAQWQWLIAAEQEDHGWVARGGAGGAGESPRRNEPWVNLAAWWGPDRFYAGGEVLSDQPIARVRLTSRDGTMLEDDTEAGVVLFLTDRTIDLPVTLELCDITAHDLAPTFHSGRSCVAHRFGRSAEHRNRIDRRSPDAFLLTTNRQSLRQSTSGPGGLARACLF